MPISASRRRRWAWSESGCRESRGARSAPRRAYLRLRAACVMSLDMGLASRFGSALAGDHEVGHPAQGVGLGAEHVEMRVRLVAQQARLRARAIQPQDRHEGRLAGRGVGADRLAGLGRVALGVQQIVDDLEGEAEIVGIGDERVALLRRGMAEDGAGLAGEGDDVAGLQPLQPGDGADVELPRSRPAGRSSGRRPCRRRPPALASACTRSARTAPSGWVAGIGQHLERHGQQAVAGEDRGRLVELLVHGRRGRGGGRCRPSPADRHAPGCSNAASRSPPRRAAHSRACTSNSAGAVDHQIGPDALAAAHGGVAHRVDHAALRARRPAAAVVQRAIDRRGGLVQGAFDRQGRPPES